MSPTTHVALVRAAHVGETGCLPMAALEAARNMACGAWPRTCIASGNLVFTHASGEATVEAALQKHLAVAPGHAVPVVVRDVAERARRPDRDVTHPRVDYRAGRFDDGRECEGPARFSRPPRPAATRGPCRSAGRPCR